MKVITIIRIFIFLLLFSTQVDAQEYVPGKIFTVSNDTIACKIFKFRKKIEEYQKSFQSIQVQDDSGRVKVLYPADILGYVKEDKIYKTLQVNATNQPSLKLFLLQLAKGRGELFLHSGTGLDGISKYFFRKSHSKEYYVLNIPDSPKVKDLNENRLDITAYFPGIMKFQIIQYEDSFRQYFIKYFADCPIIVNKLKAQIYTTASLPEMFAEYNNQKTK